MTRWTPMTGHEYNLKFAAVDLFCYCTGMNHDIAFLKNQARQLNIALSNGQLQQFDVYKNELMDWNAKTNLISEKSARDIIARHFLDSLTALRYITPPDAKIIDVGSGAGFPGLPLKIAQPSLDLYLLEANRKKVSFLKHIVRLLNLSSVDIIHDRVENIIRENVHQEKFDVLISRASFKLPQLCSFCRYFLTHAGRLIALKGPGVEAEIQKCFEDRNPSGIYQLIQQPIEAPFLNSTRKIIIGQR